MAFVPIAKACAVELRFTYNTQRAALTLGFSRSSDYDVAALQDIADKVATWWNVGLRLRMNQVVRLRETYVRALHDESAPSYTSLLFSNTPGAGAGTPLPNNVSFAVSFRTALRGRANRGRNYMLGMDTGQITGGNTIHATYKGQILGYYAALLPGGTSDPTPHRWCVLSRQLNGVATGRAVPIIAAVAADDTLDSMRKRLPGRGL